MGPGKLKPLKPRLRLDQLAPELLIDAPVQVELEHIVKAQFATVKAGEDVLASLVDHWAIQPILHALLADRILALVFWGGFDIGFGLGLEQGLEVGLNLGFGFKAKQSIHFLLHYKDSLEICKTVTSLERHEMLIRLNPVLHIGLNLTHGEALCRCMCVCMYVCVYIILERRLRKESPY